MVSVSVDELALSGVLEIDEEAMDTLSVCIRQENDQYIFEVASLSVNEFPIEFVAEPLLMQNLTYAVGTWALDAEHRQLVFMEKRPITAHQTLQIPDICAKLLPPVREFESTIRQIVASQPEE